MSYLKYYEYEEPSKTVRVIPDVKQEIKDFVGLGKKSYEEIVKEIQRDNPVMTNDDVIEQIKLVDAEWEPLRPKAEEEL